MAKKYRCGWIGIAVLLMVTAAWASGPESNPTQSKDLVRNAAAPVSFQVQTLVKGLSHPWSLAWLPSGDMLITEREGRLRRVGRDFQLDPRPIEGLPADIVVDGQGGLFDVAVHPDHAMAGFTWPMRRPPKMVHAAHRPRPWSGRACRGTVWWICKLCLPCGLPRGAGGILAGVWCWTAKAMCF
jgi:hypothetical protein